MFEFEFQGYDEEKCREYLKRIGYDFDGQVNLENLDGLIHSHQREVPFENLALIMGFGEVRLEPDKLFDKIVKEHRGGFCFELNGAFLMLLKGLGYDAAGCMARVGIPVIPGLLPLHHMGILVTLEGKDYYLDVGMGGPKADWAVEIAGGKQTRHGDTYWVEPTYKNWLMLRNEGKTSDGSVIIFETAGMLPSDFYANCTSLVDSGNSLFHKERMVNRNTETGYIDIRNQTLKISDNGNVSIRDFDEKEFPELLEKYFGIHYNADRS